MTPDQKRITDGFYLAFVLWREARGEVHSGKVAVAYSIMNRVEHPKWWGSSVITVCIKPWQYSSLTDPKDPQLTRYPGEDLSWDECIQVALDVLDKKVPNPVPGADSYYAVSMDVAGNPPPWSKESRFVAQVGGHTFYDTDGDHPDNQEKLGIDLSQRT